MEQRKKDRQDSLEHAGAAACCLDTILASMADGLVVTDKSDRIVLVNRAAEQLFGVRAGDLVQTTLQKLLAGCGVTVIDLERAETAGDTRCFDMELSSSASRANRVLQVTSLPVYDASGEEVEGAVTLFHDISRQRELDRLKTEFVSAAAHELRTPLTSIRGFSQLLLERNFSEEEQKKFLHYINQQSKQLTSVINELLDVSRIETGHGLAISHAPEKPGKSGLPSP
jgi:PAS domain S-box-containing protein